MVNLFQITTLTLIIVIIFTGYNLVGSQIADNSNLDAQSLIIINNTGNNLRENFNSSEFTQSQLELSANTSFDNVDAFSREFLEEQSEAETNINLYQNFKHIPNLIKDSIGLPDELINPFWVYVTTFIAIILIVVGFVLFFGRGKITN